jgi:ABC-type proline/glycine betaine transport system ATPase subunit
MREAVKLAQVLVIIAEGRIVQADRVSEVLAKPGTDYVAQLLKGQLE